MTFVAAQRFDQRILLIADTKIFDPNGTLRRTTHEPHAHNYIPGRLKAFPLSLQLSVAYAGRSGKALSILRSVKREISGAASDLDETVARLRASSEDGETDFLLISHVDGAQIYKIYNGIVSSEQNFQWIGDREVAPLFSASIRRSKVRYEHIASSEHNMNLGPEYGTIEEHVFRSAWTDLLLTAPTLTESVGGIPVVILGSPHGHTFVNSAGAYNPKTIILSSQGSFDESGHVINPLLSQYSYSLVGSAERGAPVVGLWVQETGSAYLYDPMKYDEAQLIRQATIEQLATVVTHRAIELGAIIVDC